MPSNLENSAVAIGLEKVSFHSNLKGNTKECSNYYTIVLISHASKIMLKILQHQLPQQVSRKLPDVQAGFRKDRNQRSNCQHSLDYRKSKGIPKNIYLCFIDYAKAFDCVDHKNWKILQETGIPDHLSCLLRNLYAG